MISIPFRRHLLGAIPLLGGLILLVLGVSGAHGQAGNPPSPDEQEAATERRGNPAFWQAELPGGHYMVRIDRVASISSHRYVVDAVAQVLEVTVTTNSSAVARFYYLEPVGSNSSLNLGRLGGQRAQQLADEASRRVTGRSAAQVIKNYPASTHAHTIEYVIQSKGQLDSLYNSLRDAIETGRGRVWVGQQE